MKKQSQPALIALAVFICMLFASCNSTTFYIVRHAERPELNGNDPHLTDMGNRRAIILCDTLNSQRPSLIFSTETNRTQETAAPTSRLTGVSVSPYSNDTMPLFINRLRAVRVERVLVVGHSNTVGAIANGLMNGAPGYVPMGEIPDNNYDTLIVVKIDHTGNNPPRITRKRYGPPSP